VAAVSDAAAQADRMWERLFELALFVRSGGVHRKPTEILKAFLKPASVGHNKLSKAERSKLTYAFKFLRDAYKNSDLGNTRLASDQTHFYIMITSLLASDLLARVEHAELAKKLTKFGKLIAARSTSDSEIRQYLDLSSKQTTDAEKRKERQKLFVETVNRL